MIGGMGPAATVDFLGRLVESTEVSSDQDHIRVLVDSNPTIPDRTAHLLGNGPHPRPALVATAQGLERAGADFLVMPCNAAHTFADDIRAAICIELVDWPGEAARAAAMHGAHSAGVLASTGTLVAGVYQRALEACDVDPVLPGEAAQAEVMESIFGPAGVKIAGATSRDARLALERASADLEGRADVLILACTEFSALDGVFPLHLGIPTIDAAAVVARKVISMAGGTLKGESPTPPVEPPTAPRR